MQIEDIVAKFSTGIFVWYNFKENAAILYLYSICLLYTSDAADE